MWRVLANGKRLVVSYNQSVASNLFIEPDQERLVRRLTAVTGGDLSAQDARRLASGELPLLTQLGLTSQQAVTALVVPGSEAAGAVEKMVGPALDFVPIAYLDLARMASKAVARVVDGNRRSLGTGTVVSPRLFLSNHHVIPTTTAAVDLVLQFDYELAVDGTPLIPTEFMLEPETFFWTSPQEELDATLVAVGRRASGTRVLSEFGVCPLSGADDKHAQGDWVTIVQHPAGDYKQVALRENRVIGRGKNGVTLHYGADTLPGSSGSPVFNDQFILIALHHAGGLLNESTFEDGSPIPAESNEGIRISALVQKLLSVLDELPAGDGAVLAEALEPSR